MERIQAKWKYEEKHCGNFIFQFNDLVVRIIDKRTGSHITTILVKDFCDIVETILAKRRNGNAT